MYNVYQREKEHREQIQIPLRTTTTLYTSQSLACIYIQIFLYPLNIYLLKSTSIVLVTRISIYLSTSITSATLHPSLFHSILLFKQFSYKSNCEDILYVLCSAFLAPFRHSLSLFLSLYSSVVIRIDSPVRILVHVGSLAPSFSLLAFVYVGRFARRKQVGGNTRGLLVSLFEMSLCYLLQYI